MEREQFEKEFDIIYSDLELQKTMILNRIINVLNIASKKLGDYFLYKGFIKDNYDDCDIYYNKETKIGIKIIIKDIYIDSANNSIPLSIVYKIGNSYFGSNNISQIYYYFKKEEPEKVFDRFKKSTGPTGIKKIKKELKIIYKNEFVLAERGEKIKNLDNL